MRSHKTFSPGLLICLGCIALAFAVFQLYYFSVFTVDDAYISYRYAENFAKGDGLVFNKGEYVEGYTNFLWLVINAAFMKAKLAPEWTSNMIGITSGALILVIAVVWGARSMGWRSPLVWIAPLCLAVNRTFCAWSTSGLEHQFFSLLLFLAALRFIQERERMGKAGLGSSLLLALATLKLR